MDLIPTYPAPPDASSSCDGGCRHLSRNGNTGMGVAAALHPLASMSTNSLGGISWCFQESAPGIDTHGDRKQPLLGAWRAAQRCFDLMGYGASMRPSLVSLLVPLHHLISRT